VVLDLVVQTPDVPGHQSVAPARSPRVVCILVEPPIGLDRNRSHPQRMVRHLNDMRQLEHNAQDDPCRDVHDGEPDQYLPPRQAEQDQRQDECVTRSRRTLAVIKMITLLLSCCLSRYGPRSRPEQLRVVFDERPKTAS